MKILKNLSLAVGLLAMSGAFSAVARAGDEQNPPPMIQDEMTQDDIQGKAAENTQSTIQDQISKEQAEINRRQAEVNQEQAKRAGQIEQEQTQAIPQRTETTAPGAEGAGAVGVTNFAFRPQVGSVFFNGNQKFTAGVLMDFNVMGTPWVKIGPAFGALYSSTSPGSFLNGVSAANTNNIIQLPGNLKVTISPDSEHRLNIGAHGGVDVIRSTAASATAAGAFGGKGANEKNLATTSNGASWDLHPNVGADLDYALSTNIDLTLRPDVTFLSDFNMITTTLGFGLKL